jgi:hypothetical protein
MRLGSVGGAVERGIGTLLAFLALVVTIVVVLALAYARFIGEGATWDALGGLLGAFGGGAAQVGWAILGFLGDLAFIVGVGALVLLLVVAFVHKNL